MPGSRPSPTTSEGAIDRAGMCPRHLAGGRPKSEAGVRVSASPRLLMCCPAGRSRRPAGPIRSDQWSSDLMPPQVLGSTGTTQPPFFTQKTVATQFRQSQAATLAIETDAVLVALVATPKVSVSQ